MWKKLFPFMDWLPESGPAVICIHTLLSGLLIPIEESVEIFTTYRWAFVILSIYLLITNTHMIWFNDWRIGDTIVALFMYVVLLFPVIGIWYISPLFEIGVVQRITIMMLAMPVFWMVGICAGLQIAITIIVRRSNRH